MNPIDFEDETRQAKKSQPQMGQFYHDGHGHYQN